MKSTTVQVNKLPHTTTMIVRVKLTRELRVRLWVGKRLLALAAFVMGCSIRIEDES